MFGQTGEPVWSAPEMTAGGSYTANIDIWSAGLVLYYMLTGNQLFEKEEDLLAAEFIIETLTIPEASIEVSTLVKSMLSINKKVRPQAFEIICHPLLSPCEVRNARGSSIDDIEASLQALKIES